MAQHRHSDVLILGAGPAGYTAAIYAARAGRKPLLITGIQPGGQLTITSEVENYPGFAEPIQGPWLMEQMQKQAERAGAEIVFDHITSVELAGSPHLLRGDGGDQYSCKTLIIATGAQAKWLGLPSEQKFRGSGVSACATCDGFFFRGKQVSVVGGGNTAVEEALYLGHLAAKVTLVHRRTTLRAERILQERLFADPRIEVIWEYEVNEILGTPGKEVTGIRLRSTRTGETSELETDGVFVAIGHAPSSSLFAGQLELTQSGYIKTLPGSTATSAPGVFAAGDVADAVFRQAATAAGFGCMAALEADRFLMLRTPVEPVSAPT
jgi:thioredoxin reductase (NADPH)